MSRGRFKTADCSVRVAFVVRFHVLLCDRSTKMVLKYKDQEIASLADIQRLAAKDLRIILRSHSESPGGTKADLVLKVYALLMRQIFPSAANSDETESSNEEFKYDSTMRRISALGWSTDLTNLPKMNFVQLYDYLASTVISFLRELTTRNLSLTSSSSKGMSRS